MRTSDRLRQYAKAGMVFAATTATYFFARVTGALPSWFDVGKSETTDIAISEPTASQALETTVPLTANSYPVGDLSLTDFEEINLTPAKIAPPAIQQEDKEYYLMNTESAHSRHRLLQQSVIVVNPIPDQIVDANLQYQYPLDNVFSGDFTLLGAKQNGQISLPSWLDLQYEQVGILPANAGKNIVIQGNIGFITYVNLLVIANLTNLNPDNKYQAELLNFYVPGATILEDIIVKGNLVFLADGTFGVGILNVTDLAEPVIISTYFISGGAWGIALQNDLLFVADSNPGLHILNINNLAFPREIGSCVLPSGYAHKVAIQNNLLITVGGGMQLIDVSNPSSPHLIGNYQSLSNPVWDIVMQDNLAFIVTEGGMEIINITNPVNPFRVSDYYVSTRTYGILVQNNIAFLAATGFGLLIIDCSTPQILSLIGAFSSTNSINDVAVQASMAYVVGDTGNFQIDLRQAKLVSSGLQTHVGLLSVTVSAMDTIAVLAENQFRLTIDFLPFRIDATLLDQSIWPDMTLTLSLDSDLLFTNPNNVFLKLSAQLDSRYPAPAWLNLTLKPVLLSTYYEQGNNYVDIAVKENIAFIVDNNRGPLTLDVSDLVNPRLISTFFQGGPADCITIDNNIAFLGKFSYLEIINIENAANITQISAYDLHGSNYVYDIAIENSIAFTVDLSFTDGLKIVNISNLENPSLISSYTPPLNMATSVAVRGDLLLVGEGVALILLNVTDLNNTQLISVYSPISGGNWINKVIIQNDIALVASGNGLWIVSIENPAIPKELTTYFTHFQCKDIIVEGDSVFIANAQGGLQAIDIKNPSAPVLFGSGNSRGEAVSLAIQGNTLLVAEATAGLEIIDISQWQLIAHPTVADVGNYKIKVIAADPLGGEASSTFTIRVEGPPQIHGVIPTQYAKVGQPYHYFVAEGLFTDPNLDPIDFTATLSNEQVLPAWLSFNSIAAAFAGTPRSQDVGNFTIIVTATDHIAGSINTSFVLSVDYLPVLNQPLPAQVAGVDELYQWVLAKDAFFVPSGNALTYVAQQSNGQALPSWLHFNETQRKFFGIPSATEADQYYSLVVVASDAYQGQAQAPFTLLVEYFPQLNLPINNQLAIVGDSYTMTIPVNTFVDSQARALLYNVRQTNTLALPNWLSFNSRSLVFSGVAQLTDVGVLYLELIATDPSGGWGQLNFNLTVTYRPLLNQPLSAQLADIGALYQWVMDNNTFTDPLNQPLTYSVQPLPDWLSFNPALLQLSGTPYNSSAGAYDLTVTARNTAGAETSTAFSLLVEFFPQVNRLLNSPWVGVGQGWALTVPSDTFLDRDNEPITYRIKRVGSSLSLPNWLSFNPQTLLFSGVPQVTDIGRFSIRLTATDPAGGSAFQDFNVTVTIFPVLNQAISTQVAGINQSYSFLLPPDLFTDPQQQLLQYSARQQSEEKLPAWLIFDNSLFRFSGVAESTQAGRYELEVLATNEDGAATAAPFSLIAEYLPQSNHIVSSQWAAIDEPFILVLPSDTFIDPEGDALVYQARQLDGTWLPNWLSFNRQTLTFSGIPQATDEGMFTLRLTATDSQGGIAQQLFNLTVSYFPIQNQPVLDQVAGIGLPYAWAIPQQIFMDPLDRALIYTVNSNGSKPLPSWLEFNSAGSLLFGKPNSTQAGEYDLELIAQNGDGATSRAPFTLMVEYFPRLTQFINSTLAGIGQSFNFAVPVDSFIDEDDDSLNYQASLVDDAPLPNWLSFNRQSLKFSGVPAETDVGTLSVQLTAMDSRGGYDQTNFTINVVHFPVVAAPISPQILREERPFVFSVPPSTFFSPDGLSLTYQASQKDGSALPNWLRFTEENITFSGTPLSNVGNSLSLLVIARDTNGAQVVAPLNFNIRVNTPPQVQQPISDQTASVGALFNMFIPADTFVDADGDSLAYSAEQSNGDALPDWLRFNTINPSFAGTPGRGDTDTYAIRTLSVRLRVTDGQASADTVFNINIGGLSYLALAIAIGGPLLTFFTALYAVYRERALFLNYWNRRAYEKVAQTTTVGECFAYELETPAYQVHRIQVELPRLIGGRLRFFKSSFQNLPAGNHLPSWMEYNTDDNVLRSKGPIPASSPPALLIKIKEKSGVIREKFTLQINRSIENKEELKRGEALERGEVSEHTF